jgi:3-isopropylmalate dehydrogenase
MNLNILILPGDGIGVEVTTEAVKVLRHVAAKHNHTLTTRDGLLGGCAIHATGTPFPEETAKAAAETDATLLGAVGLPEFDNVAPELRPEKGLLGIRKALGVYANLRPVKAYTALIDSSPLKNDRIEGVDMIIVRELNSGIYYGTPRGVSGEGDAEEAVNTMYYSRPEIERITRMAFELAGNRRKKVTSVDKSNVLEVSQLWRKVVVEVAKDYPDIELNHVLVDNAAMQLILNPRQFDVIVTGNMFGDILSDEASVLAGSLGMLPSASLGEVKTKHGTIGMYEPIHGSSPSKTGLDIANPTATILSAAMMLRWSLGQTAAADAIETAVRSTLDGGTRTKDLMGSDGEARGWVSVGTAAFGEAVAAQLRSTS